MYRGSPVIVVTPAGRRRYMPLISKYIYQHKGLIDKWVLWANTKDQADLEHLMSMEKADSEFVRVQLGQDGPLGEVGTMPAIRAFYNYDMLRDAIYLRIDDDICYMHPDAIPNLVKFRFDNPQYFCITANMVNSGLCSHLQDRMGLHPNLSRVPWESAGGPLHWSSDMATLLHDKFMKDLSESKLDPWMCYDRWELWESPRFGIAFIALLGKDIHDFIGKWSGPEKTDEEFFTTIWPKKIDRMNCICGKSLIVHFAYGPQRGHGMETRVDGVCGTDVRPASILERYKAIAGVQ